MAHKLAEETSFLVGVQNADITTKRSTGWIPVSTLSGRRLRAIGLSAALADTKKVTVEIERAKDGSGDSSEVLATGAKVAAGAVAVVAQCETTVDKLVDGDFTHFRGTIVSDNGTGVLGALAFEEADLRFSVPQS